MKKLILLAFMLITNVFAGYAQETYCGDKSLSYCINHFDRQCKAKDYFACYVVGTLHDEQEQYSQAKKYYEMVCDKANSKDSYKMELAMQLSCGMLGVFYSTGKGVRQSYEKAFQYFNKACDLGDGIGCVNVGFAYLKGEGVRQSYEKAFQYGKKACELKNGRGCALLGIMYDLGEGVKQNPSKAKELFGKACDLGNQDGCDDYKKLKEKGY